MLVDVLLEPQPWPEGFYKLGSVCPAHLYIYPSVCPSVFRLFRGEWPIELGRHN